MFSKKKTHDLNTKFSESYHMKIIIIVVLAIIVGLVIIGGGLETIVSYVEEGTEKIKQNEKLQDIKEQISTTINSEIEKSDIVIKSISESQNKCDPSYPDVCIVPYPLGLDCGEISYSNFRVIGSDLHGFDKDGNGIGCEK